MLYKMYIKLVKMRFALLKLDSHYIRIFTGIINTTYTAINGQIILKAHVYISYSQIYNYNQVKIVYWCEKHSSLNISVEKQEI